MQKLPAIQKKTRKSDISRQWAWTISFRHFLTFNIIHIPVTHRDNRFIRFWNPFKDYLLAMLSKKEDFVLAAVIYCPSGSARYEMMMKVRKYAWPSKMADNIWWQQPIFESQYIKINQYKSRLKYISHYCITIPKHWKILCFLLVDAIPVKT